MVAEKTLGAPNNGRPDAATADGATWSDAVHQIHMRLLQDMDAAALERLEPARARSAVESAARQLLSQLYPSILGEDREDVISRVIDEAVGFGPIDGLLGDITISEVMVNSPGEVYYEREGIIYGANARFRDNLHIMRIIERIIAPLGRRVDESSPYVDARLPDGSRVNVIIPPVAPFPTITVRKFRPDRYHAADLVSNGTMTQQMHDFFRACVQQRLNIVISGGTGTGKTTFLNAISEFIPSRERIVSVEDPLEMKLKQRHVIPLEARPPNIEGRNEITQRDLVRNALRMRPDRIIVGEVRGAEAFDMLQAMNTGHEGSLTTVHANGPRDALARIENMVLMAGFDLPVRAIREQIASALHVVVQLVRFSDGKRRISNVSEITGLESGTITTQELYRFEHKGVAADGTIMGELEPTGITPTFAEKFRAAGHTIEMGLSGMRWS
ncbi:MAG TPA: CpaF family protein [Dehalococcoidia bacterium]|jgi:pilus assembly protein CpaF|nr:CpaF family protein [Dehalococcoidia bacterium]